MAFTPLWVAAHQWLRQKLAGLPVEIHTDAAGNLWVTLAGESERALLLGGHLDSVPDGGWLDGCLNVLAGVEVLRRVHQQYPGRPPVTVRLVAWADEEGARFGKSLFGSSACSGHLDLDEARRLRDRDGVSLPEALRTAGVDFERVKDSGAELKQAAAYLELHIEQGPVLLDLDLPLGAVLGTLGVEPTTQLRQNTLLEEAGVKFDLLGKALFVSIAGFKQERAIPVGQGDTQHSLAHITGAEIELNYQPTSNFFATASYSYLHTVTDTPFGFYNFPAQAGINYDGAATAIAWQGCAVSGTSSCTQKFIDPGVPAHLFNALANYKMDTGLGFQANLQVTGPVQTTQAGYIDIAGTEANLANEYPPITGSPASLIPKSVLSSGGYYNPPTIPWQYTLNTAVFYSFLEHYNVKFEIYNLTDRHNLLNDQGFYGNDFLTRAPPRSYDLTFTGKF